MRPTTSSVPLCNVEERRRAVSLGSNGQAKSVPPATSSTAVRKLVVNPRYLTGWRGCHRAGERSNPSLSSGESGRFDATDLMAENKGSGDPRTHRHGTSSSNPLSSTRESAANLTFGRIPSMTVSGHLIGDVCRDRRGHQPRQSVPKIITCVSVA